ncbi:MAG: hypothetical protein ACLUIR_02090 [Faecalibacterium prausnitzii]
MDVFKSKPLKLASAAFYILLAMLCFYCACYRLPVGLKYGINLMMAGWALLMFLSGLCSTGPSSVCAFLRSSFPVPDVLDVVSSYLDFRIADF